MVHSRATAPARAPCPDLLLGFTIPMSEHNAIRIIAPKHTHTHKKKKKTMSFRLPDSSSLSDSHTRPTRRAPFSLTHLGWPAGHGRGERQASAQRCHRQRHHLWAQALPHVVRQRDLEAGGSLCKCRLKTPRRKLWRSEIRIGHMTLALDHAYPIGPCLCFFGPCCTNRSLVTSAKTVPLVAEVFTFLGSGYGLKHFSFPCCMVLSLLATCSHGSSEGLSDSDW